MFFRVLIAACLLLAALDGAFAQGVDNQPSAASGEQPGANEVRTEQPSLAEQNKQQAAEYRPDCKRPQDDKEADLCEQRRMAKAAEDAVVVASDQYWLAWLTFGALVLTVAFTACAAVAGALTVCAMRDTTKRQLRAYVHIEDVKIVQANDDRFSPNIQIIIKNFGGTPAYDVRNTFMCRPMISASADFSLADAKMATLGDLGPTQRTFSTPVYQKIFWDSIKPSLIDKSKVFYVFGRIDYRDAFRKSRWTEYRFELPIAAGAIEDETAFFVCLDGNRSI